MLALGRVRSSRRQWQKGKARDVLAALIQSSVLKPPCEAPQHLRSHSQMLEIIEQVVSASDAEAFDMEAQVWKDAKDALNQVETSLKTTASDVKSYLTRQQKKVQRETETRSKEDAKRKACEAADLAKRAATKLRAAGSKAFSIFQVIEGVTTLPALSMEAAWQPGATVQWPSVIKCPEKLGELLAHKTFSKLLELYAKEHKDEESFKKTGRHQHLVTSDEVAP